MYAVVIGEDTLVTFFQTAGIRGHLATDSNQARDLVIREMSDPETGVIIVSEKLARDFFSEIAAWNLKGKVIFPYPDPEGTGNEKGIADQVLNFLGVSL